MRWDGRKEDFSPCEERREGGWVVSALSGEEGEGCGIAPSRLLLSLGGGLTNWCWSTQSKVFFLQHMLLILDWLILLEIRFLKVLLGSFLLLNPYLN